MKFATKKRISDFIKIMLVTIALGAFFTFQINASSNIDKKETDNYEELEYKTISEIKDKEIGILTGTVYDGITKETLPNANYQYFANISDLTQALLAKKIDAFLEDENIIKEIMRQNKNVGMIPEVVSSYDVGLMFSKDEYGQKVLKEFNEFVEDYKKNGLADELFKKWENYDENTQMLDYESLPYINGNIKLATSGMSFPFCFVLNNNFVGYDAELVATFCQQNGYSLEFVQMDFAAIIADIQTGKSTIGCGGIAMTEERMQQVNFSIPTNYIDGYAAVRKNVSRSYAFFNNIKDNFYNTFIKEDRWKMFVSGIATTLSITVLSLILGTALGFLAYKIARRDFSGIFAKLCDFIIWLIHGMPTVVLLMILYYIIFGKSSISGFYVSIIGFTIVFSCSMFNMLKSGERAVDKGQSEAAFTLGYSETETFNDIILPQAAYHFMPSYKAEIISLIKATAVVGYIAVQDITKSGDIIRSRTYEAFFPLIVTAIMYFVMAAVLVSIVSKIDFIIDPDLRNKDKILKGVQQYD